MLGVFDLPWRSLQRFVLLGAAVFFPLAALSIALSSQLPARYETQAIFVLDPRLSGGGPNPGEMMRVLALKAAGRDQLKDLQTRYDSLAASDLETIAARLKIRVNSGREKATVTTIETSGTTPAASYDLAAGTQDFLLKTYLGELAGQRSDTLAAAEDRLSRAALALREANDLAAEITPVDPRDIQALRDQITQLDRAIAREELAPAPSPDLNRARLEAELAVALARLSPEHPRVRLLQAELSALPRSAENSETRAQLGALTESRATKAEMLINLQARHAIATDTRTALAAAVSEHRDATAALDRAQHLATTSLGRERARLNLVVPAELPEAPRFPGPAWLTTFGTFLSALIALAAMMLAIRLDSTIRVSADLERKFGIIPFATFPEYPTQEVKV